MEKKWVIGNWKMNIPENLADYAQALKDLGPTRFQIVLAPPATHCDELKTQVPPWVLMGGQMASGGHKTTSFTGDISPWIWSKKVQYVLVGHSETRLHRNVTTEEACAAAREALKYSLTPVYCFGESALHRQQGDQRQVWEEQLTGVPPGALLAYEPIWAIGSNQPALPEQVKDVRSFLDKYLGKSFPLLYGGSIDASMISLKDFCKIQRFHGFLVGRASWEKDSFVSLLKVLGEWL